MAHIPHPLFIDFDELRTNSAQMEELVLKVLELFVQQAPAWIIELRETFYSGDASLLRKICHRIHGGAATVPAIYICETVDRLHEYARDDNLGEAEDALLQLLSAIKETIDFVRDSGILSPDSDIDDFQS